MSRSSKPKTSVSHHVHARRSSIRSEPNDVGVLTENVFQSLGETLRVFADLTLVYDRTFVRMQRLDRVFDGHDVRRPAAIDDVDERRQRRRLAAETRRAPQLPVSFPHLGIRNREPRRSEELECCSAAADGRRRNRSVQVTRGACRTIVPVSLTAVDSLGGYGVVGTEIDLDPHRRHIDSTIKVWCVRSRDVIAIDRDVYLSLRRRVGPGNVRPPRFPKATRKPIRRRRDASPDAVTDSMVIG